MTKSLNLRTALALSALAAIMGVAIATQSRSAAAREVLSCDGAGRQSVVECCERQVMKKGLPMWMRQTGANCRTMAIRCSGGSSTITHVSKTKCVAIYDPQRDSHGNNPGQRGGGQNGPNAAGKR